MAGSLSRRVGLVLVAFALGMYAGSVYLAMLGKLSASVLVGVFGSVSLIVGADLIRED